MNTLEALNTASRRMHQPPLAKLMDPGAHKFMMRLASRLGGHGREYHTRLFFGDPMTVVLPEVISETLYTYGFFDETVTRLAIHAVKDGDTVLDVGAHFGYFSLLFSHLAGDRGHVVSFEPTPSTFRVLEKNTRTRDNITALNLGVGDTDGELEITDFGLRYAAWNTLSDESRMPDVLTGQMKGKVKVGMVRLDGLLAERNIHPDVIKIDAENFELPVVRGLAETIAERRPKILMETGTDGSLEAARLLVSQGYDIYVLDADGGLSRWEHNIELANQTYKDLLFATAQSIPG
ncbi:MAG: FkbM family methyltransferase [Leptospirillia bacterium]